MTQEDAKTPHNQENPATHPDKKRYYIVDPKSEGRKPQRDVRPQLLRVATGVGIQWPRLARQLEIPGERVRRIQMEIDSSDFVGQCAAMFGVWEEGKSDEKVLDNELKDALIKIGQNELAESFDKKESNETFDANQSISLDSHDLSAFNALEAELGSPRSNVNLHVSSPYPYRKPSLPPQVDVDATKAEEEDENISVQNESSICSGSMTGYDSDKPHFVYIPENEGETSSAREDENGSSNDSNDKNSTTNSQNSVCSEIENKERDNEIKEEFQDASFEDIHKTNSLEDERNTNSEEDDQEEEVDISSRYTFTVQEK